MLNDEKENNTERLIGINPIGDHFVVGLLFCSVANESAALNSFSPSHVIHNHP